ncbi:MAG TPA: nuclear transport factor 2 family protein [Casimicrobiaceae bacterium]|nr:nuclear transport factor 2 family protein [Casimicrobiaceae bacterium]
MTDVVDPASTTSQHILALEKANRDAFIARDYKRLDELWSDDFLVNSPINRVHTKQQVLALLKAGTIAHARLEAVIDTIERRDNLWVVMGSETVINTPDTPAVARRFTNVWRLEDGTWRVLLRHANVTR